MRSEASVQSGFSAFLPRARLLRLIGAELISDDVVAVTELVKNAHDADATFVSIHFMNVTDGEGEIMIRDDGHGMSLDTLLTRWMQPAGSTKGRDSTRFTASGRRVLGEKGVGRFATDKLAAHLELVSRQANESLEVHAAFDWNDFDVDDRMLSDVCSKWEVRAADWLDSHGTMLRLTRLRSKWTERMFRRLCTRLARLMSPFDAGKGFRILVESDEFPQYSGEVGRGYLEVAPYKIEADFDGSSAVSIRINGARVMRHVLPEAEQPACGPVKVRLFGYDLETDALSKLGPRAEVRAWLREWSGISVYRDGFRIWPYGEPHDDWLRLDQRRVNNPVIRLSNNQVVGFVEITSDRNPELRDQTNREGLIHNESFDDLQRFVIFVMQLLEAERQALRHPQSRRHLPGTAPSRASKDAATLPDLLENLARKSSGALTDELRRAADRARAASNLELQTRKRLLEGYTELAATGQTAVIVGRSVAASLVELQAACATLRSAFGRSDNADEIIKTAGALNRLEATVRLATQQLHSVRSVQPAASKRRRGLDLAAELDRFASLSGPLLDQHDTTFVVDAPRGSVLRTDMRPELFSAVISSLTLNSLEWRQKGKPMTITALVRVHGEFVEVTVQDTGRGITTGLENTIFEPMVSGRDGTGMGLTIARSILETHGGSIELVVDRRRKGATFKICLPRKKARSTVPASGSRQG